MHTTMALYLVLPGVGAPIEETPSLSKAMGGARGCGLGPCGHDVVQRRFAGPVVINAFGDDNDGVSDAYDDFDMVTVVAHVTIVIGMIQTV